MTLEGKITTEAIRIGKEYVDKRDSGEYPLPSAWDYVWSDPHKVISNLDIPFSEEILRDVGREVAKYVDDVFWGRVD